MYWARLRHSRVTYNRIIPRGDRNRPCDYSVICDFSTSRILDRCSGITLVELIIVIAIISVLVTLLLPGVQALRESTRRAQCQNNLKQVALALLTYHEAHDEFPGGGWGHSWVGVPERGVGRRQPGGWIYSTLPYIEESELHELGSGMVGSDVVAAYSARLQTPIPLFVCPSRRSCSTWPIAEQYIWVRTPKPFGDVRLVARADYAINGGTSHLFSFSGPRNLDQGDSVEFWSDAPYPRSFSGISHLRIAASSESIVDGSSKTYLVGEKYLDEASYATGTSLGDNESLYAGYCTDLHRFTGVIEKLKLERSAYAEPLCDKATPANGTPGFVRFGSAHAAGFNIAHCDGSGHFVTYGVDPDIHLRSGHRGDYGMALETLE